MSSPGASDPRTPEGGPGFGGAGPAARAAGIAGAYAVFATLWIYFSDQALALLVPDPEALLAASVWKGLAFVAVTALLLFLLMRRSFAAFDRLARLNSALSHVNQAIVRMPVRDELFRRVTQVLVEQGGFRAAWIGWHNPDTRQVEPAASWGDDTGELLRIRIYTDDRPEGQGPSGTAFRAGQPYICNDMQRDPAIRPWREQVRRHHLQACAVLPVREQGQVRGLLSVYANQAGYFQDREVALLEEAATDLSFALDNLVREAERRTAEAAVQAERMFSDTMIESMPGILYLYDMKGRFLRWNRNFERVSGYGGEAIARMHPLDFFAPEERPLLEQRIAEVFRLGESSAESEFITRDGRALPYFFTGRRVEFAGLTCLVGVGIDITERKRAERALRELNETLEHKVVERTAELQAATVRAEAADRIKSAFLATMSHELRTPLNSIIGFTGIVLQGLAGPLNEEQAKQLGMVRTSARHLLELINDVLDISRIEAGQLEVRADPFDLPASLERVTGIVRPLADQKGLALQVDLMQVPPEMVGDRRRVEQVLLNLLNNAIKFTQEGQVRLVVDMVADFQAGPGAAPVPAVRFRVQDTGIGIQPEDLDTLFQPFRQIDTGLSRQHEGTGLGLAICRRLADLLGGVITATSEWGRGSEFTLILPVRRT